MACMGEDLVWPVSQTGVFLPVTSSRLFLFWIFAAVSLVAALQVLVEPVDRDPHRVTAPRLRVEP